MDLARLADARSLEFHREVAERLKLDPGLVAKAQARVLKWAQEDLVHPAYQDAWKEILGRPVSEICAFLIEESERACALRHVSPFAGFVDARTRWHIWRTVRDRMASP